MHEPSEMGGLLSLGLYTLTVFALTAIMIGLGILLGPRRRGPADRNPFESGIPPIQDIHIRFPVQFYVIAMLFVLFDLEMMFVFAWAPAARAAGWTGYLGMLAFLLLLLIALGYLWRAGALEWNTPRWPTGQNRDNRR